MIVSLSFTIHNPDGSKAMGYAVEETIPVTSPDPVVNGGRALMRFDELVDEGRERIHRQAGALGVTDERE